MGVVQMKQLLEAGVHFGHQTRRWNPKMAEYIFTERNGIYIIDLQKTVKMIEEAYYFTRDVAAEGGSVLFVGTKKQAQEAIKEEAERTGMYYVNARWLGGMLTNFKTIKKRISRLFQLDKMAEDGTMELLPKKEVIKLNLEKERLEKFLGGISFEIYLCHMVIYRVLEKLHLVHLFGNGLLAYIFTAIAVICGSVVFSVCAKWFLNKVETFLKERVRRVNHV